MPTQFDADIGFAIPIANTLEILGDTSLAGSTPVHTEGSGNTITTFVQVSQAIAATDATKIGLSAFDSSMFTVDANGFVGLVGGGLGIDSLTGDDGVAVGGDAAGNVNFVGSVVPNATNPKPLYFDGDAVTFTQSLELQVSTAIAAAPADTNDAGICSFNNTQFEVDTNGFVQLIGGGAAIEQFTLDDTNVVTPSSGNVNMFGQDTPNQNGVETYQISASEIGLRMASPFTLEDFTFSTSTASTTRNVNVTNSDNTSTTSDAALNVTVGGASGGDPYSRYTVGTARSFATGLDNTDSDKYKWVTAANATATPSSGTQIMEMSTSGDGIIAGSWTVDSLKLDNATLSRINAGAITLQPQAGSNLFFDTVIVNHGYDNAGGLTQNLLQNNSATAGSRVQFDASFSNSTGKAAYSAIYSGGPNAYIWGIDAADSNKYKLGYEGSATPTLNGSTAIMTATTTGAVSFILGNVDVTKSSSGATVSATVSNTSNTASSNASVISSVGGTSAGDPVYQSVVSGTTTWTWGADNSVTSPTADPWVLAQGTALGTNNVMSVATSGEINYPLQPAFMAFLPSTEADVTGDGTVFQIGSVTALTEVFDQNGDFNTNGTFTAPVTGRYMLIANCLAQQGTAVHTVTLRITTSNATYNFLNNSVMVVGNNGLSCSVLCDMDAADIATYSLISGGSTKTIDAFGGASDRRTNFSGFLMA